MRGSGFIRGGSQTGVRLSPSRLMRLTVLRTYLWLAGNEGMEQKMEVTIMGYIGLGFRRNGKENVN